MKRLTLVVAALLYSVSAYAQPPAPPECKDLPNGGTLSIPIPGVTVPTACKSCVAGFPIPPNFVLGYSNGHHDTCELKKPTGENSGQCKADTTCPPGTSRTYQNNTLWVCQSAGTVKTITCPAPPKLPDPPAQWVAVTRCIDRLKSEVDELKARAGEFVNAGKSAGPGAGATPKSIGGAAVQAGVMGGLIVGHTSLVAAGALRKKATCDNIDKTNNTSVRDCNAATSDYNTLRERHKGFGYKYQDARRVANREIGEAIAGNAGLKTAGENVDKELDDVEKTAAVCVTEMVRLIP